MTSFANGESALSVRSKLNQLLSLSTNLQTGTSYTILASDEHKLVAFSNSAPVTCAVPPGLGAGFSCKIAQLGAGSVSVSAGSGVSVNTVDGVNSLQGQYAKSALLSYGTDNYVLSKDVAGA